MWTKQADTAEPMDGICVNFQNPLPIFLSLALRQLRHTGTGRDEFCPREGSSSDRRNKEQKKTGTSLNGVI